MRHPLCVDAARGTAGSIALAALAAADRAWDALTGVLGAPAPDAGASTASGTSSSVVPSRAAATLSGASAIRLRTSTARRASRGFQRSSSPGCSLDFAVARAVARGSLWRAAPATDEASARAEAETLAGLATPCAGSEASAFQSNPERAIVARASPAYERGAGLFFGWLDATFLGPSPERSSWVSGPSRPRGPLLTPIRWAATPTGFDVLRESLKNALWQGSTLDDVLVRFAVARATLVPPARLAWHVGGLPMPVGWRPQSPWRRPVRSHVLVDCQGAPAGAKLRLEAEWEDYGRMRWVVVKLDAAGHALGDLPVASLISLLMRRLRLSPLQRPTASWSFCSQRWEHRARVRSGRGRVGAARLAPHPSGRVVFADAIDQEALGRGP